MSEEFGWESAALGQEMRIRIHGHDGRPVIGFPSQAGRYWDYEAFGLIEACGPLLDAGRLRLITVDSIDGQTWNNYAIHPADRARRHEAYDRYLVDELLPFVVQRTAWTTAWAVGVSMGAYHAANLLFRHPDVVDGVIALSGIYQVATWVGDYMDEIVYLNSPLHYLPELEDPWYLERIRRARIAIAVGQGAWEEPMIVDTRRLEQVLAAKHIPALVDYWGHDVDHDWPWWRRMLPYFLERLRV